MKIEVDEKLCKRIKKVITQSDMRLIYESEKQFVNIAVLGLLKNEEYTITHKY